MLSRGQAVASVVLDHPECAQVLKRHRIDFCCRGDVTLEAAAAEKGVDVDALLAELSRTVAARHESRPADPRALTTPDLIEHIVSKHHAYLRGALPFLGELAAKVGRVHGEHNPKLRALDQAVGELKDALLTHLDDEEKALFPALAAKDADRDAAWPLLEGMFDEHLAVAKILERIRAAADDFSVPDWGCNSYRTLFAELRGLESDVFTHVHLENHVLRPRFAPAEAATASPLDGGRS